MAFSTALEQHRIHSLVAQNLFPELLTRQHLANQVFWIGNETKTFQDEMFSFSAMNVMDQEHHKYCLPLQGHPSSHDPTHKYQTKESSDSSQVMYKSHRSPASYTPSVPRLTVISRTSILLQKSRSTYIQTFICHAHIINFSSNVFLLMLDSHFSSSLLQSLGLPSSPSGLPF